MRRMSRLAGSSTLIRALHSGHRSTQDVVNHIPHADVFRFGDSNRASPVLKDVDWTVNEGENWAVVGSGSGGPKTAVLQVRKVFTISHLIFLVINLVPKSFPASTITLVSR